VVLQVTHSHFVIWLLPAAHAPFAARFSSLFSAVHVNRSAAVEAAWGAAPTRPGMGTKGGAGPEHSHHQLVPSEINESENRASDYVRHERDLDLVCSD
jgi:hypothetical protein